MPSPEAGGMGGFLADHQSEILTLTGQHIVLVAAATSVAILMGVPLGVLVARKRSWARPVLGAASILQTIPSLALFGFLIPLPFLGGIGARTAIAALVVYALLPIVRGTYTGIRQVPAATVEAGTGLGMTGRQILWWVELPLALPVIMAGIRVATVVSVGVATIAAAIGAGG